MMSFMGCITHFYDEFERADGSAGDFMGILYRLGEDKSMNFLYGKGKIEEISGKENYKKRNRSAATLRGSCYTVRVIGA